METIWDWMLLTPWDWIKLESFLKSSNPAKGYYASLFYFLFYLLIIKKSILDFEISGIV